MSTIWTNSELNPEAEEALRLGVKGHRLVIANQRGNNLSSEGRSPELDSSEIAFGQPDVDQIIGLAGLKWIHLTSAGYTRYDRQDVRAAIEQRQAQVTNSSAVFDDPCAQHVLAFMLAHERGLLTARDRQSNGHVWDYAYLRGRLRTLDGDHIAIIGYGSIGRRLVELLAPFGVKISAIRRTVRGDEGVETHPASELRSVIGQADHVVNLLPSGPGADDVFDAATFAAMKPGAVFYNVGRGATVNQPALIAALASGHLAGAYLDVTTPEPLPPDDPLWAAPNCYITPHVAGGHQDEDLELVRHFLANLRRFEAGEPLLDRIM